MRRGRGGLACKSLYKNDLSGVRGGVSRVREGLNLPRYKLSGGRYTLNLPKYKLTRGRCALNPPKYKLSGGRYALNLPKYKFSGGRYTLNLPKYKPVRGGSNLTGNGLSRPQARNFRALEAPRFVL